MVALFDLHGVAQCAGGARNDGDLLHGRGICLLCGDKGMAYLVICNYVLFVVGHNSIFLLVAGYDDLDALLKVCLSRKAPSVAHGAQSRFIDDICKLGARCAGGHARDLVKVNVLGYSYLFGVDL